MVTFNHFNFNVLDLDRSLAFYQEALELEVVEEPSMMRTVTSLSVR